MPFILLPPLGGIRGGACVITLNFYRQIKRKGKIHAPPLELFNNRSVTNHKRKFKFSCLLLLLWESAYICKMGLLPPLSVQR